MYISINTQFVTNTNPAFIKIRKNHKRSSHLNRHLEFKKREATIISNSLNNEMFVIKDLFKRDILLCPLLETTSLLLNVKEEFACFLFQTHFTLLLFPPFLYHMSELSTGVAMVVTISGVSAHYAFQHEPFNHGLRFILPSSKRGDNIMKE